MRIKVYQINQMADTLRVKFMGLQETQDIQRSHDRSAQINPKIYDVVFSGDVDCQSLEDIYTLFNTNPPPFFRGHSLSMSDILQTDDGFFFCDRCGFKQIDFKAKQTHKLDTLLRVVALEPGKPAYVAGVADHFRASQQAVDGRFEVT
ncbi:MAG: YodL domain-containing protein [Firmicutes bacterium]|nr:YodL domain-containing protein [Bacillota bacterium]